MIISDVKNHFITHYHVKKGQRCWVSLQFRDRIGSKEDVARRNMIVEII